MPRANPETRRRIVDSTRELMLAKGFAAVTIDEVCRHAGVTKGSLFHYFRNKDDLAREALLQFCQKGAESLESGEFASRADPLDRLFGQIDFFIGAVRDPVRDGCLVGVLAQELDNTGPEIQILCGKAFGYWIAGLRQTLDEAVARHRPRIRIDSDGLAAHFVAVYEGSLVVAKATRNPALVARSLEHYRHYLESLFATDPAE